MFVASPHTHVESPISGSSIESFVSRAKALGRTHFSYTDPGYMTSLFATMQTCKSQGLKFIPGVEVFFKDPACPISHNTASERARYFKLSLYAQDQAQFEKLSQMVSRLGREKVLSIDTEYDLWAWKDLEEAAGHGLVACTGDLNDIALKHLITGRGDLSKPIMEKLKSLFQDRLYVSIVGVEVKKTWTSLVKVVFKDGTSVVLNAKDRIATNATKVGRALELVEKPGKHYKLLSSVTNYVMTAHNKNIDSATLHSGNLPIQGGDVQLKANKLARVLAGMLGIKLLYSDYSFYASPEDKAVQDIRLSQDGLKDASARHMQSTEEAMSYMVNTLGLDQSSAEGILLNNAEFASRFDKFSLNFEYSMPDPGGNSIELIMERIKKLGRMPNDQAYRDRLAYEIDVLHRNGKVDLLPYFLPICGVMEHYAKEGKLTGPGRGSAGGSLLAYLIGITQVDPIKRDLSFERFISLDRVLTGNLPDIDSDLVSRETLVGKDGRSGYLYGTYGDRAAQISTRIMLRLKSAIKDVNRYLKGSVEPEIERLSKALPPPTQGVSDKEFVFGFDDTDGNHTPGLLEANEDLKSYAESRPKEWDMVQRCLGISRQYSKHASAFVIADKPISQIVPTFLGGNVTQYEAKAVEKSKLIKYDFLVVNQLADIELCIKLINRRNKEAERPDRFSHQGKEVWVWDLPEDRAVFESTWEGATETVFQISTNAMIPFVKKIKPTSIDDLATILALVRPGPLDYVDPDTGRTMADEYVERRFGRSSSDIPELANLLPETYGVMVFQEQTSKVARQVGKMKPTDAEELRRIFSKKEKAKALKMKPVFMEGAVATVGQEVAEKIWAQMETSSRYSFNKSHAVAYAMISYSCMFLKHYYPLEWWAAVLTNAEEGEISSDFIRFAKDKLSPPDVNVSTEQMEIDYEAEKIRAKITVIKGLGENTAKPIIENRPYADINDFVRKKVAGPSLTKKLIHAGVLDSLFPTNTSLESKMQSYEDAVIQADYDAKKALGKNPKPPKRGIVDPQYMGLHPLADAAMKKAVLPTLPLYLHSRVLKYGGLINEGTESAPLIIHGRHSSRLFTGQMMHMLSKVPSLDNDMYYCVGAYVLDMSEFSYSKNTKKALKMILDVDGFVSEQVLWPDFESGQLKYPEELKKGSIALFMMKRKADRDSSQITSVKVLYSPVDNKSKK